jgi:hypothetical protein
MAGCYSPAIRLWSGFVLTLLRSVQLAAFGLILASPALAQSAYDGPKFIGAVTVPNDQMVDGTLVGGLSGIDYDAKADVWYLIADDKSDKNPARFYTARLAFNQSGLSAVTIQHAVTLLQADGTPYPNTKSGGEVPDPESIRRDPETGNCGGPAKATASSASPPSCGSRHRTASRPATSRCQTSSR